MLFICKKELYMQKGAEAHSELTGTSNMELFAESR